MLEHRGCDRSLDAPALGFSEPPEDGGAEARSGEYRHGLSAPVVLDQAALTSMILRVVACGAGTLTSSMPFACFASTWATSTPSGSSKLRSNAPYASSWTK